jgi:hypothetical protein
MSNNTNFQGPPIRINNGIQYTDYRPNKALYVNVYDNNKFRLYMQRNGNKIRAQNLKQFEQRNGQCGCEGQPKGIVPFQNQFQQATCKRKR